MFHERRSSFLPNFASLKDDNDTHQKNDNINYNHIGTEFDVSEA